MYECGLGCHCNRAQCRLTLLSDGSFRLINRRFGLVCEESLWYLVTLEEIAAGAFILELAGEVRSSRNAVSEVRLGSSTDSYSLDMSGVGNLGAFVRGEEGGNCRVVRVWTEHRDPRMSRVAVFAKGEIRAGEKLTVKAEECNFAKFNFDSGRCCAPAMIGNGVCNNVCDNEANSYDGGDCCLQSSIGNHNCDECGAVSYRQTRAVTKRSFPLMEETAVPSLGEAIGSAT